VEQLWEEWQRSSRGAGRRIVWVDDEPVLLVWVSGPESTAGLVAGSEQLSSWIDGVEPTFEAEGVTLAIADVEGRPIIAKFAEQPEMQATRAPPESGLPLTVQVVSASLDADFAQFAERRRLLLLGMSVVAMLVLLGLYAVMRGVTREPEAARLQSNFVSAVSHEFRTPLTSMRQLTELLASGRVASDERREHYYAVIKRESERLHRLVEGRLDSRRIPPPR